MSKVKYFFVVFAFLTSVISASDADQGYLETYFDKVEESSQWLIEKTGGAAPKMIITLTAGIEKMLDEVSDKIVISSDEVPHFPTAHVEGHSGKIIFGKYKGSDVVLMQGRYHYYEGLPPQKVVFPYFVFNKMGAKYLVTTNAVGGIREDLNSGDIMMVTDHINYMANNPLINLAFQFPTNQFTDMTAPYSPELREVAQKNAGRLGIELKEGVYIANPGPSYETKAEIKAYRHWGADAVGMSTVFEVIAANYLKMKVLAFSGIANPAADRHTGNMNHHEVEENMQAMGEKLSTLTAACAEDMLTTG